MSASPFSNDPVRFLNKDISTCERSNYDDWWREQINIYGSEITYYVNKTSLDTADSVYGEEPESGFKDGVKLIVTLNLNENAVVMQKFGLVSDDEVTCFIHIQQFYDSFGESSEPKAGDVFDLSEFGEGRPGGRSGNHFEITERIDQDVQQINQLTGHYIWLIKAKRHDYSFEPGIPRESVSQQVEDNVREESIGIFDYTDSGNDDVYGGYV